MSTLRSGLAVQTRALEKEFVQGPVRTPVLRGVDFEARLGEITMLAGPSGCGKTTLLSVVTGLLDRDRGDMRVLGEDTTAMSPADSVVFRRRNVGFVFQQYNLLPALTAAENAAVPLLAEGMPIGRAVAKARDLLGRLGLGDRADALPSRLSGGQQQRVALARALVHDPRLIVCDEPTSALDAQSGHAVMRLLASAAVQSDRAVIVVTHDSRVFEFADTMAHMEDGRIARVERRPEPVDPGAPAVVESVPEESGTLVA
jgi:putative ABC transport system ATP-binding protein